MSKKIVLTGGGTAGHVTPNIALIPELQERGYEIEYIGSKKGLEKEMIEKEGIPYHIVSAGKLRRYLRFVRDFFLVFLLIFTDCLRAAHGKKVCRNKCEC